MCFTDIGIPILTIYKTVVKRTKVTDAPRVESMSRPYRVRVTSVLYSRCPYQICVTLWSHSYRIRGHGYLSSRSTFVRITSLWLQCRVRVISLPYPCVNLHKDMPRMWHEYDKDNTDAGRTWHEGDTDLIRTFVHVSYFDCFKIMDTDKFGPGDRGGHDKDVIRTWTGRQGHDTDTSLYRKYKDYVYRKMLVQEYLKKWRIFKRVKPKNDMMYHDIYNCICQNTKK